jgi:AsmA-like C-terminal region
MASHRKHRFWRRARVYFRRFRFAVWLCLLALVGMLVYLNQIGLPDFVKSPLLEKLRARGVDLQFSRLRLSWDRGILAENVRFGRADLPSSPQLLLAEVRVQLNYSALRRFQLQIDSLLLRHGRLVWPVPKSNHSPRALTLEDIQTRLRFLPDDEWALDDFQAGFAGAKIQLSGTVTHASAVREWKFFQARRPSPPGRLQNRLVQFADTLERIHFSTPPELRLNLRGDAHDPQGFSLLIFISAPSADTPWGNLSQGRLTARLSPSTNKEISRAAVKLEAVHANTKWASATNLQFSLELTTSITQTNLQNADLRLDAKAAKTPWAAATGLHLDLHLIPVSGQTNQFSSELAMLAGQVVTQWGTATNAHLSARSLHSLTNPIPLASEAQLDLEYAWTSRVAGRGLHLQAKVQEQNGGAGISSEPLPGFISPALWACLQTRSVEWNASLDQILISKLEALQVAGSGSWRAPALTLTELHGQIESHQLALGGDLDLSTRALRAKVVSDVNPHTVSPLLTEGARRWLADYSWDAPPAVKAEVRLVLPAWSNRQTDWRAEVQPTLQLEGQFKLAQGGAYRSIPVTTAQSHFVYSNLSWHLPDLVVTRPEGRIEAEHWADDRTKEYHWRLATTLDPLSVRPLLDTNQQRALDLFTFSQPPAIEAEIWGRWHAEERLGIQARIALTNFTFRGETASSLITGLQYTNRVLQLTNPRLRRGIQLLSADGLAADFVAEIIHLTNGFSTAEPQVVARAIGPHIARTISPYAFSIPPTVHAQGIIPMHNEEQADLRFHVEGGPFHWSSFNVPYIGGDIHWAGLRLMLNDVHFDFYGGTALGSATFLFFPDRNAEFQFALAATNTLLQGLTADLSTHTNHLEGRLAGNLLVTKATVGDWRTVNGHGNVALRDGLIWDIPLFGIASPVLDAIAPGLGSSRANSGTCTFLITNGVIHSTDLELRSPAMRLQYRGDVDLDGRVNARLEAGLLRDMWLFGPLVSTVLWPVTKLFEYKVTGTLANPKSEPLFLLPKIFLLPLHPLRTLKGLLPEDSNTRTNAPPGGKPELKAPKSE